MSLEGIKHYPVMLNEVINYLSDQKNIIDCTFGGGGYSKKILEKFPNSKVTGIDRDKRVIKIAEKLNKKFPKRFRFQNIKFSEINSIKDFQNNDYFILDLGVSNFQLRDSERSFSFNSDKKLDMGMGLNLRNAYDLINQGSMEYLKNIFKFFGEEKFSSKIAKKIVNLREKENIVNSQDLSNIINNIKFKKGKTNPSTKSFQALRMIVNEEISEIFKVLKYIIENCKVNAVIIVVSFHSLEDKLVKKIFNFYGKNLPVSRYIPTVNKYINTPIKILTKKPIVASKNEIKENPSSRSAKLRVIKKINNSNKDLKRTDLNMERYFKLEENYV